MTPTLDEQIVEVRRELRLRRWVYPKWVERSKLSPGQAEQYIARMQAALDTLEGLKRAEQRERQPALAGIEQPF